MRCSGTGHQSVDTLAHLILGVKMLYVVLFIINQLRSLRFRYAWLYIAVVGSAEEKDRNSIIFLGCIECVHPVISGVKYALNTQFVCSIACYINPLMIDTNVSHWAYVGNKKSEKQWAYNQVNVVCWSYYCQQMYLFTICKIII
jgi:hypothetical protein